MTRTVGRGRAAAMLLVATAIGSPAAYAQAPPDALDDYVVFALTRIDVSSSVTLSAGSIGANADNGSITGNGPLTLDPATGVIAAATTNLNQPSTCAAVFANAGTGECADAPRLAVQPPLVADPRAACGFPAQFPACDSSLGVTVGPGETLELPPGTYGDVTVSDGTLTFAGGEYVVCNLTANQVATVGVAAPTTVMVVGRVNFLESSSVNPDLAPADFRLLVNDVGSNIQGAQVLLRGPACRVLRGVEGKTRVRAFLCAPNQNAQLNLLNAVLEGTFLADTINVGNVTGSNGPLPPTTTTTTSSTTTTTTTTTSSTTTTSTTTTTTTTTTSSSTTTTTTTSTTNTTGETTSTTTTTTSVTTTTATTTTTTSTAPPSSTTTTAPPPTSTSTTTTTTSTTTSTTLEGCDTLQVTSSRLVRSKDNPDEGRLVVRGFLARSGWADVDPTRSGIGLSANREDGPPLFCCSTDGDEWTKQAPRSFAFAEAPGKECPVDDMLLITRRNGRARFKAVVPRVDLSPGVAPTVTVVVVAGDRCALGVVQIRTVRPKFFPPPKHDCN